MGRDAFPKIAVGVVIAAAVFSAGLTAGWVLIAPSVPNSLQPEAESTNAPVGTQEYFDKRTVSLGVIADAETTLASPTTGRVTALTCVPGTAIESGQTFVRVDEIPLVAMFTEVPLWRDIAKGDKGRDVAALQTELSRLGYSISNDGVAGNKTLAAMNELLKGAGYNGAVLGSIPATMVIWIPAAQVTIASCDVGLGDVTTPGADLASLTPTLTKVFLQQVPDDMAPGERILTVDSVSVPIGPEGVIEDAAALAQLAVAPSFVSYGSHSDGSDGTTEGASGQISGYLQLSGAITIRVVPPNAVYAIDQSHGCVTSKGESFPVTVVGSQLGQTYVLFESDVEVSQVDLVIDAGPPCR